MAPLTPLQKPEICWFGNLPVEIALVIARLLPLKDKLAFADACRACRSFVSEKECRRACRRAGLSQVVGVSARAMAKLLYRPRKGVCNWSHEGGVPKEGLKFSQAYSVQNAILQAVEVALHPAFGPVRYVYLHETQWFDQVTLRVAQGQPDIMLSRNRLYMHEFATCPPLTELRVLIKEDEGPIKEGSVAFRIRNPCGVTLENYWKGLFRFLHREPDPEMYMTDEILRMWYSMVLFGLPRDPFHNPNDEEDVDNEEEEEEEEEENLDEEDEPANPYFARDCPTNLAMLNTYCARLQDDIAFSEKGLMCELPLERGSLELMIHASNPHLSRAYEFIAELENDIQWGEPVTSQFWDEDPPITELDEENEDFWEDAAPLIQF